LIQDLIYQPHLWFGNDIIVIKSAHERGCVSEVCNISRATGQNNALHKQTELCLACNQIILMKECDTGEPTTHHPRALR
jgi:hypothetical protein